mgnify:CR=1 FL=1
MKKSIISIVTLLVIVSVSSCGSRQKKEDITPEPLNISVYLDLSDRLTRNLTPSQTNRDTAIINYLVDYFRSQTLGPTILKSENKMKVFFYPTPNDTEISMLAQGLSVDIGSKQGVEKRKALDEMKGIFQNNLAHIYEETLKDGNWIGCDIWDFFSNKKVDNLCVKDGARNIVVILTDGELWYNDNIKSDGKGGFNYIQPSTLSQPNSYLIDERNGELKGKGIEVLMLEINPQQPNQRNKMMEVLEKWFDAMGIEKFVVAETDANLTNTQTIIQNFLDN